MKGNYLVRFMLLTLGSVLMGIGVSLAVASNLGADSVAFLWEGMSAVFHCSIGQANLIFSSIFLIIIILLDKKQIGIGTVLCPVIQGITIDCTTIFLLNFNVEPNKILLMLFGIILIGIGCGVYAGADIGKGPYIGVTFALFEKRGISLTLSRSLMDALCLILGLGMGAKLSIGPLISVFVLGIVTTYSCDKTKMIWNNL